MAWQEPPSAQRSHRRPPPGPFQHSPVPWPARADHRHARHRTCLRSAALQNISVKWSNEVQTVEIKCLRGLPGGTHLLAPQRTPFTLLSEESILRAIERKAKSQHEPYITRAKILYYLPTAATTATRGSRRRRRRGRRERTHSIVGSLLCPTSLFLRRQGG